MTSGHHTNRFPAARPEPVGRGEAGGLGGFHGGQAGEDVRKIFLGTDPQAAAVFHDGVKDGALLAGFLIADEEPVFRAELGWTDRVFHKIVADFDAAVAEIDFKVWPLAHGVCDGLAEFALGQDDVAGGKFVDGFLEPPVDHAACGGTHRLAQGGTGLFLAQLRLNPIEVGDLEQDPSDDARRLLLGLEELAPHVGMATHEFDPWFVLGPGGVDDVAVGLDDAHELFDVVVFEREVVIRSSFEQFFKSAGVTTVMPVEKHAASWYVGRPEVAGLGLAAAGFEVIDGGFVNLSVKCPPMFVLDFPIDNGKPVGGEQRPIAESLAVKIDSHAGEHFLLTIVGQMADEAIVHHFGDEPGRGDAALLQGRRQRVDERLGAGIVLADEFAAHELDADELGGFEVELLAHFLTDAAEGFGIEQDFGRIEFLPHDGQMFGDARGAGLFDRLLVGGDFSRRSWVCGSGGGVFFCGVGFQQEFELGGIEFFARYAEDAAGQRVDGLAQHEDLGGLARNLI